MDYFDTVLSSELSQIDSIKDDVIVESLLETVERKLSEIEESQLNESFGDSTLQLYQKIKTFVLNAKKYVVSGNPMKIIGESKLTPSTAKKFVEYTDELTELVMQLDSDSVVNESVFYDMQHELRLLLVVFLYFMFGIASLIIPMAVYGPSNYLKSLGSSIKAVGTKYKGILGNRITKLYRSMVEVFVANLSQEQIDILGGVDRQTIKDKIDKEKLRPKYHGVYEEERLPGYDVEELPAEEIEIEDVSTDIVIEKIVQELSMPSTAYHLSDTLGEVYEVDEITYKEAVMAATSAVSVTRIIRSMLKRLGSVVMDKAKGFINKVKSKFDK